MIDRTEATTPPAPALPLQNMLEPVDDSILKPELAEKHRAESVSSSSVEEAVERPKNENGTLPPSDNVRPELSRLPSQAPSEYPGPKQVFLVMTAILLSVFLVSLDRTIIATAIPSITDEFHSLNDIGWYASGFMLTACCFQLVFGRIYTFYTPKYVFLALITVFEIGSAICGAAPNSIAFIIGRAVAGIGSAGIMSGAIILMVSVVPLAKRPAYQGFFGAVFGISSVCGPLLGGAFTTNVSWRWCFYINLPIGAVSIVAIMFLLKPTPPVHPGLSFKEQLARLDLLGQFFLLPSIICLLLALQWGGSTYDWSNWRIIFLFTLFGITFMAFAASQIFRQDVATISIRIIKNRSILAAMWFTVCLAGTMLMLVFYISIWFQAIKGTSAVQSGIDNIPMVLALVIASIFAGVTVGKIGYYAPMMIASSIIMPIGAGLIYTFDVNTTTGQWIGYQILIGFGIGVGMQQGAMAAQTVLAKKDVPMGVTLVMFMQQFGGAIFVSVGQNVFQTSLVKNLTELIPGLNPASVVNAGATNLRSIASAADLPEVLVAYNNALRQVFLVATCMACLSVFGAAALEWRSVKKGGPRSQPSDEEKPRSSPAESVEEKAEERSSA